eukprot:1317542-Prymnesium_polylepis.1
MTATRADGLSPRTRFGLGGRQRARNEARAVAELVWVCELECKAHQLRALVAQREDVVGEGRARDLELPVEAVEEGDLVAEQKIFVDAVLLRAEGESRQHDGPPRIAAQAVGELGHEALDDDESVHQNVCLATRVEGADEHAQRVEDCLHVRHGAAFAVITKAHDAFVEHPGARQVGASLEHVESERQRDGDAAVGRR